MNNGLTMKAIKIRFSRKARWRDGYIISDDGDFLCVAIYKPAKVKAGIVQTHIICSVECSLIELGKVEITENEWV